MSENLVLDPPVTAIENMSVTEALDELRHDDAVIAQYEARKIRAMHRIHELRADPKTGKSEFASDEIALEMRWDPVAASRKVDEAVALVERLPGTVAELEAGHIDLAKARAIHDLTTTLSPEQVREVERMVLPRAGQRTLRSLRDRTRTAVLRVDQDG